MQDKKSIETVAFVGMGALGIEIGSLVLQNTGAEGVAFLMDEARAQRHRKTACLVNGEPVELPIVSVAEATPVDLIIVGVKYPGLKSAIETMRPAVGEDTVIISMLNGITSEAVLSEAFGRHHIVDCIAIGMDVMREGTSITYSKPGKLQIGCSDGESQANLAAVQAWMSRCGIPHEVCPDITRRMWIKLMMNVGINQTCMVYHCGYGGALVEGTEPYDNLVSAMQEVIAVAHAQGIDLTEEDLQANLATLRALAPDACPSMEQDRRAGRRCEVELFAGEMVRRGKECNIPVPVNEYYLERIRELEEELVG